MFWLIANSIQDKTRREPDEVAQEIASAEVYELNELLSAVLHVADQIPYDHAAHYSLAVLVRCIMSREPAITKTIQDHVTHSIYQSSET